MWSFTGALYLNLPRTDDDEGCGMKTHGRKAGGERSQPGRDEDVERRRQIKTGK